MTGEMSPEIFRLNAEVEQRHWWFAGRRRIVGKIIRNIIPLDNPADLIVDIGCGTGANIASLAGTHECVGIDPSPDAISLAQQRFPDVKFICGSAPGGLGEMMRKAKVFLLMDVLEHVAEDAAFLRRITDAAPPGAWYIITVPADMDLWGEHDVSHGHYRRYDRRGLETVIKDANLDIMLLSYFNSRLYPLVRLLRSLARRRKRSLGRAGTDLRPVPGPLNAALRALFAGEYRALAGVFGRSERSAYPFGVSLIAVARSAARREAANATGGGK